LNRWLNFLHENSAQAEEYPRGARVAPEFESERRFKTVEQIASKYFVGNQTA